MRIIIPFCLLGTVLFFSCGEDDRNKIAVEKVINEEIERRVNDYRRMRINHCKEKAITEANEMADSILIEEARLARDTITKPPKPEKPEKPELKSLQDSTPVKPLVGRDSLQE